ncbi:hypothetical protein SLA2020_035720 [Shorea laevis]
MSRRNPRGKEENIAVAIDKDKGSQFALKWTVDHLLSRGQAVTLLHVRTKSSSIIPTPTGNHVSITNVNDDVARTYKQQLDNQAREVFLPFRCFCTRKDIKCNEVILEETDIPNAIIKYVSSNVIDTLVLGAPSRSGLVRRFKIVDVTSSVSKGAPDYCTVYVIGKGKISSIRPASTPPPRMPSRAQLNTQISNLSDSSDMSGSSNYSKYRAAAERPQFPRRNLPEDMEIKSPFTRAGRSPIKYEPSVLESDISFVSSGRPSTDHLFPLYDMDNGMTPQLSISSDYDIRSFGSSYFGNKSVDLNCPQYEFSSSLLESGPSQNMEDVEAEMRRLKLELKQTMDMYSAACKEALTAKQKARELHIWKMQEEQRMEEARLSEEATLALIEKEKVKCKAAIEAAEAAKRIAELEAPKRMNAEMSAVKDVEDKKKETASLGQEMYRRYTIEEIEAATDFFTNSRKIGEGGYGPVYKAHLDHTPVAIKVLRPDAAHGRAQFQQEVEVLSLIRHPNMVLLLGACPEYGCLVYEYMSNGSLEDRLFQRGNTAPLSWQVRFRIAAEIATGLLFLHQTKPEPLVHRDLKPGNILLDRNYVSKISDVGLARLVPPSVANSVTQYRMTSTAGTFCYIDPEYQQTGMLGTKSDIYSFGVMLLQMITAKPPMGLTHHVERAIEKGTFVEVLDPAVPDWPIEEALIFAKLALKCAELRKKDRPDLGKDVLPELNRLRMLAEDMPNLISGGCPGTSPDHSHVSCSSMPDFMSESRSQQSGYDSSRSRSSSSSFPERT